MNHHECDNLSIVIVYKTIKIMKIIIILNIHHSHTNVEYNQSMILNHHDLSLCPSIINHPFVFLTSMWTSGHTNPATLSYTAANHGASRPSELRVSLGEIGNHRNEIIND